MLLFIVVQLLESLDFLLSERVHALPGAVDVRPTLPLDEVLGLPFIFVGVKAFARVAILFHSVHGRGCTGGFGVG